MIPRPAEPRSALMQEIQPKPRLYGRGPRAQRAGEAIPDVEGAGRDGRDLVERARAVVAMHAIPPDGGRELGIELKSGSVIPLATELDTRE